jgi:hypothetical protein
MRLVLVFLLTALVWVSPALLGDGGAWALMPGVALPAQQPLAHDAKFVCGMTDEGFKCRSEPGAIRRGKMPSIPKTPSGESPAPETSGGDEDALPPAPGGTGTSTQAPRTAPATCPANSELLGGHCIPYTQTCRKGLAANANPPPCRGTEEKQVCNYRADGLKNCCCRTYSKF